MVTLPSIPVSLYVHSSTSLSIWKNLRWLLRESWSCLQDSPGLILGGVGSPFIWWKKRPLSQKSNRMPKLCHLHVQYQKLVEIIPSVRKQLWTQLQIWNVNCWISTPIQIIDKWMSVQGKGIQGILNLIIFYQIGLSESNRPTLLPPMQNVIS